MQTTAKLNLATPADYPVLAYIGHEAFHADKLAYGQGPRVYEHPEFLIPLLETGDVPVYKLVVGTETVGFAITSAKSETSRWLGCLCILPEHQGKGYGSQTLRLLEQAYPAVCQWGLDTPAASEKNRSFYERAGYCVIGESSPMEGFQLLTFEKRL